MERTDKHGNDVAKGRIRPALRTAINLIVADGLTIAEAAKAVGYKAESLSKALLKPHVRTLRADVKRAWLSSQTERAWLTVANLADKAASEDVRLKAARTILEASGELTPRDGAGAAPPQLIQIITRSAAISLDGAGLPKSGVVEQPAGEARQ